MGVKYWVGVKSAIPSASNGRLTCFFSSLHVLHSQENGLLRQKSVWCNSDTTRSGHHFHIMALVSIPQAVIHQIILSRQWQPILFCCTINKMSLFGKEEGVAFQPVVLNHPCHNAIRTPQLNLSQGIRFCCEGHRGLSWWDGLLHWAYMVSSTADDLNSLSQV